MKKLVHRLLVQIHVPLIVLIRLLRPLVLIRFGWLQTHKIGHLPLEGEFYLCERLAGIQPRSLDFFYDRRRGDGEVCNPQAMRMLARHLRVSPWVRYFFEANRLVAGAAAHEVYIRAREEHACRDLDGLFDRFPVQIDFTAAEKEAGFRELERLGVPKGAKYVCVHVRDAAYWRQRKPSIRNDSDFRNSDIADFIPAIEALLEAGYHVLRIGFPVADRLPITHPRFIDYSFAHRTPFMDVFLAAECHLMVSTGSGIDSIAYMFRRPILMCNLAPVGFLYSDSPRIVNMLKLHRRKGTVRLMSYREVNAVGADVFVTTDDFIKGGIDYLDAPGDVIRRAAIEAVARLSGRWTETAEDRAAAARFWQLYAGTTRHRQPRATISGEFLRAYPDLF